MENNSIMLLIRSPLSQTPAWEWLGPDWTARIITHAAALDIEVPDGVEVRVVNSYDATSELEAAVIEEYRRRPFARLEAFHERDLLRAARLRGLLRLPGQSYVSALSFRDKVRMKDAWTRAGVPVTDYVAIEHPCDLLDFAARHEESPIVVKPRLEAGSRGVSVLQGREQTRAWLDRVWSRQPDGSIPFWLAEGYVEGQLMQVDGIVHGDRVEICWPSQVGDLLGWRKDAPGPVMFEMLDPSDALVRRARALVARALDALPTPEVTAFHAEMWVTPEDDLVMNEIGARVGGALTAPMIKAGFGVDLRRRFIECALDPEKVGRSGSESEPGVSAGFALLPRQPGLVVAVDEVPERLRRPWLLDLAVHVVPGVRSAAAVNSVDAAAHCLVMGADRAQVSARLRSVTDFLTGAIHYQDAEEQAQGRILV